MPDVSSGGLPRPLTSFIGRERELAQARRLLAGSYLVTLTGPGGSGKTRLCIALAAEVAGDYPDGVYFAPLAPIRDPELVPSTIAQSLRLQPGLARKDWLERVEVEHNNIRAAIGWYREHAPPAALRMAAAMTAFWSVRGHYTEGRQRLDELLALAAEPSVARVSALNGAAWLAIDQGDYAHGASLLDQSIGLGRALGDTVGEAIATVYLGRCKMSSPGRRGGPQAHPRPGPLRHHEPSGQAPATCTDCSANRAQSRPRGRARTCMRSPCGPNRVSSSAGSAPALPNQCGTRVSNSAASPGFMTRSCSASRSRSRPERLTGPGRPGRPGRGRNSTRRAPARRCRTGRARRTG